MHLPFVPLTVGSFNPGFGIVFAMVSGRLDLTTWNFPVLDPGPGIFGIDEIQCVALYFYSILMKTALSI